ncbi:MAG TPA: hypothetical protein VEU73_16365 [Gemmatimonadales bacterium]|nr:hypothetical protein [Gemmatimonadales bacterium]
MPSELWDASTTADVITIPTRTVLALEGQGAPEGPAFQHSVGALYGVAYILKFARKKAGLGEFKIGPLEARWWVDDPTRRLPDAPRDAWRWQLRMAVPQDVSAAELVQAIDDATHKKGGKLEGNREAARIALSVLPAARVGRVLHIGPYAAESESFARIADALKGAGLVGGNAHSEVYLNDPRRSKPAQLKTVLLLELAKPAL